MARIVVFRDGSRKLRSKISALLTPARGSTLRWGLCGGPPKTGLVDVQQQNQQRSDGDLVRQTLGGETAAYEELVGRWAARIVACCHAKVRSVDAADDLAQETLVRGFRFLPALDDPDKFGPWLRGIAQRTCLDWLKAKARRRFRSMACWNATANICWPMPRPWVKTMSIVPTKRPA